MKPPPGSPGRRAPPAGGEEFECSDVLAELSNFLDGDLSPEVRREMERHLRHCRSCRIVLDSTRRTLRILADDRTLELPGGLAGEIMEKIRKRKD